jgi:hypothetical protein
MVEMWRTSFQRLKAASRRDNPGCQPTRSIDFVFEPKDFDPDFDRASGAETNLRDLFKDVVGCESIIEKLDGYLRVAKGMRAAGLDPTGQIPMNFIFKGPPGKFSLHLCKIV